MDLIAQILNNHNWPLNKIVWTVWVHLYTDFLVNRCYIKYTTNKNHTVLQMYFFEFLFHPNNTIPSLLGPEIGTVPWIKLWDFPASLLIFFYSFLPTLFRENCNNSANLHGFDEKSYWFFITIKEPSNIVSISHLVLIMAFLTKSSFVQLSSSYV